MGAKIDEIIRKISESRAFTEDSYLRTTHFAIFLLFGCSDEIKQTLELRAQEIVADKKAVAFLSADAAEDIVADVRAAVEKVSESGVDLSDLRQLHFCPVIVSDKSDPEQYGLCVDRLLEYGQNRSINTEWKPFLILEPEKEGAAQWLDIIAEKIRKLGVSNSCRCCVLTRKDEDLFAVNDERLLNTILFVAILHVVTSTREGIGRRIAYIAEHEDELFYTAQTAFVSNPVIIRTLRCMRMLLDRMESSGEEGREIDMSFVREILAPLYKKLPHDGDAVSLVPLYGVLPEPNGDLKEFERRLWDFAKAHYLQQFQSEKEHIYAKFKVGFLRAFIASGKPVSYLQGLLGNSAEIGNLSKGEAVPIGTLPALPKKSGISSDNMNVYRLTESKISTRLNRIGSVLLTEFFESEEFAALPKLYSEAKQRIRKITQELTEEVDRRSRNTAEIFLDLVDDPDEKLVEEATKQLSARSVLPKCVAEVALSAERNDSEGIEDAVTKLVDSLYDAVKWLSGGSGAQAYMGFVSSSCLNPDGDIAKRNVTKVGAQLKFPVRFAGGGRKYTFVWGSKENSFYTAWERQQELINSDGEFLPFDSKERFVLLSVSSAFTREDILGVSVIDSEQKTSGEGGE